MGALIPLLPWFFSRGNGALVASVVLGALAAAAVGLALSLFSGRSRLRTVLRQLGVSALAAGVTYGIGSVVGVSTG